MDMETDSLRWFQLVADGATVTEVADLSLVSQPGVSRALARLDAQVGAPLLRKSGRVLRPTHAGTVFKRHVDALLHELDDGLAAVQELVDPERGTVQLAFQLSLGTWLVPRLISQFRAEHPRVEFRFLQSQDALGSSLVADGRIDLEITARRPRNPAVRWEPLLTERLALAVPPGHDLAGRERVALADAADAEFVALDRGWGLRTQFERLCEAAGFAPRVVFESDDLTTVRGFVSAGLGLAVLPDDGSGPARPAYDGTRLIPLTDEGAAREVGVAWSQERRRLPSAELFLAFVLTKAAGTSGRVIRGATQPHRG